MNSTVPLPDPVHTKVNYKPMPKDILTVVGYTADQMRTHAAAQSAADNAVLIANLAAAMSQFALEEKDNDVLRERVKLLEDALGEIAWSNDSAWQADRARAALEKPQ